MSDGQESPHLNQLTQLTAKTGFQIGMKVRKFLADNRGISKSSQLQINFTGSYKKECEFPIHILLHIPTFQFH